MKKIFALLLSFCMLFSCAMAEGFVPGAIEQELTMKALEEGKMIVSQIVANVDLDTEALGLSDEEAALVKAVCDTIGMTVVEAGIGVPNGESLRMSLAAHIANEESTATVDAALNITAEGIVIESSLLDSSVSLQWDTMLSMAGLTDEQIADVHAIVDALLSLTEEDINALNALIDEIMAQVMEIVEPIMEQAATMLAPYGETVMNWVTTLSIDASEEGTITVTVSAADIASLINALAEQAAADEQLLAVLDMFLGATAEYADGTEIEMTAAELCDALKEIAAMLAEEDIAATFTVSVTETGLSFDFALPLDETVALSASAQFFVEDVISFSVIAGVTNAEYTLTDGIALSGSAVVNPENENEFSMNAAYQVFEDGETIMNEEVSASSVPYTTDANLPGIAFDYAVSAAVEDVNVVLTINSTDELTADNGESEACSIAFDIYADETPISIVSAISSVVTPSEDGYLCTSSMSAAMPAIGLNSLSITQVVQPQTYTADESVPVVAAETLMADEDALNTFMENTMGNAFGCLLSVIDILPAELSGMLMGE